MTALIYFPIVLSLAALGAHFLRYGSDIGVLGMLLLIGLLFVRRPWAPRIVQASLVLGAVEWLHTLYGLAQYRAMQGQSATRMTLILGGVALLTFCCALLFETQRLRRIYRPDRDA